MPIDHRPTTGPGIGRVRCSKAVSRSYFLGDFGRRRSLTRLAFSRLGLRNRIGVPPASPCCSSPLTTVAATCWDASLAR